MTRALNTSCVRHDGTSTHLPQAGVCLHECHTSDCVRHSGKLTFFFLFLRPWLIAALLLARVLWMYAGSNSQVFLEAVDLSRYHWKRYKQSAACSWIACKSFPFKNYILKCYKLSMPSECELVNALNKYLICGALKFFESCGITHNCAVTVTLFCFWNKTHLFIWKHATLNLCASTTTPKLDSRAQWRSLMQMSRDALNKATWIWQRKKSLLLTISDTNCCRAP